MPARRFTLVVRVDDAASPGATIADTAAVSSSTADPNASNNSAGATTTVATTETPDADLQVTTVAPPKSVMVGQPLTWTTTVTNHGPAAATGVTLVVTVPDGATFVSATGGAAPSDGVVTFHLADLPDGASSSVTVVVEARAVGTLTSMATASADETGPSPSNNSATATSAIIPAPTPTPGRTPSLTPGLTGSDGPVVVSVKRYGYHARPTRLVLTFNQPLTPARAQDRKNYRIVDLHGRVFPVRSVAYDASNWTVTLHPFSRLDLHQRYKLTILGTGSRGLTGDSGQPLDGARTGQPGSNYQTLVRPKQLVWPIPTPLSFFSWARPGKR